MGQLAFDRGTAERLDAAYRARDIVRRRELVYATLRPQAGERILDVGCGPGYYVSELLERVGPGGFVTGLDRSPQMLELARERTAGHPNVAFGESEATGLRVGDAEFDAALSVQVLEYVKEVDLALAELHRALRPGGRVVVWDIDWTTVSWHTRDVGRLERVAAAWDRHLVDPALPRTLAVRLRRAGFEDVVVEGHAFVATEFSPDAFIGAIFPLVHEYVAGTGDLPAEEVDAWATEQRELAAAGEFFFACTQFCFAATKPA